MKALLDRLSSDFLPQLLAGMTVNFEIAGISLFLGLLLGMVLAAARLRGGVIGAAAASAVALMRAAPTFVVMFFLLNSIPRGLTFFGVSLALSGSLAVAVSLVPYSAAYVSDSGVDALDQLRRGSPLGALLFLPNITRAFFVLVMSSSAGAAIGVVEGISVILRFAEKLPALGDKLVLFAIGIILFGIPLQAGFMLMSLLHRYLRGIVTNKPRSASPASR